MKEPQNNKEEWEDRFEKEIEPKLRHPLIETSPTGSIGFKTEDDIKTVKTFISQLLLEQREEIYLQIEKMKIPPEGTKEKVIERYSSYNQAIDEILNQINKK